MGGRRLAVNVKTIASNALPKGAGLHRNTFTSQVANRDNDFDAIEFEFVKRESGKRLHATRCDTLALPGLAHPVTEVAKFVLLPDFIKTRATKKIA
jgi:hypothetical protein